MGVFVLIYVKRVSVCTQVHVCVLEHIVSIDYRTKL